MSTPRVVALLRAINVGGHVVRMERLRELFGEMGYRDAETLIASGNVLFGPGRAAPASIERKIEAGLASALGYEVATMVRTGPEIRTAVERASAIAAREAASGPREAGGAPPSMLVAFLKSAPPADAAVKLSALESDDERLWLDGRELYWYCRIRLSDSKLPGGRLEKILGVAMTVRNVTTVAKIGARLER